MRSNEPEATARTAATDAGGRLPLDRRPIALLAHPFALVLGGALVAMGMGLHLPAMPEDVGIAEAIAAAPTRWMASHLFLSFGLVLVAIAAIGVLPVVRGRGTTLATVGIGLTALGAVVMALSDMAHGALGFALVETVDVNTSLDVQLAYYEHPVVLGLNTGPLLLTLGMIVLGAGLLRSRAVPRWEGLVVLLTPVAVNLGFHFELPTWLHGLPFLVGMAVLARVVARPLAGADERS